MKGKILQKFLAIVNIITLTMVNFVFLGTSVVSYAADAITAQTSTNHKNVDFEVYFKNDKGEKVYTSKEEISKEDVKLYASIEVKQEGYFNGKIILGNTNFNINSDSSNSDINKAYIEKIENNEVTLNQIKAGEKIELELLVNPIKDDNFNIGLLNMQSEVKLSGIYKDSTQKDITIEATRNVELYLTVNKDPNPIQLGAQILTNQILKVSGENKRVVQVLVNSGLENNVAPIKNTKIEVGIPVTDKSKIEQVEAYGVTLDATNSALAGNLTEKLTTDEQTGKVSIVLENNANEKNEVEWKKTGNDQIIFTFICKEDAEVIESKLRVDLSINVYSANELSATAWYEIGSVTEKSGIVTSEIKNAEDSIYKGKMYAGLDKEYKTKTNINVNVQNVIENISIKENAGEYYKDEENLNTANTYFTKTTFNKNNITEILGEEGTITILDQNGTKLSEINSNTQSNEKGNIEITYPQETVTTIEVLTTKPVQKGKITYINNKVIKATNIETAENANKIVTTIYTLVNKEENENTQNAVETKGTINLEESKSEAEMTINKDSLYTITENKNVEIIATLKTNSEANNLYKNPELTITLPEEVEEIELVEEAKLLYENELQIKSSTVEGRQIIVTLEGEQTKYNEYETKDIEGATIVLKANVKLDKTAANATKKITMKYTNEKDNKKIEDIEKEINIVSPQEVITTNNIEALEIETRGEEKQKEILTKVGTQAKELEVKEEIINNNGGEINNVKILGNFPTNGKINVNNTQTENNMGVILKTAIVTNQKVYYTENENATEDLENAENAWTEEVSNLSNVKKYLIELDSMNVGDKIEISYKMEIPENLEYNKQANQGYIVKYTNSKTGEEETKTATYINITTGQGPVVEATLSASVGKDNLTDNGVVKTGEVIKYHIQVKNTGSDIANNIKVVGNVPEGTVNVEPATITIDDQEFGYQYVQGTYYQETENKTKEFTIETLQPEETKDFEYEVRVNNASNNTITNNAKLYYKEVIKDTNRITNKVENGDIRISVKSTAGTNAYIKENSSFEYDAIVENIGDKDLDNIEVNWNIPSEYTILSQFIDDEDIDSTNANVKINSLKKGEKVVIGMNILVNKVDISKQVEIYATAKQNNNVYRSNIFEESIIAENIKNTISISSENENGYVKTGDIINYNITITNTSDVDRPSFVMIEDNLPEELSPIKIIIDGEEQELDYANNEITTLVEVEANKSKTITLQTVVDKDETRTEDVRITNKASIVEDEEKIESNTISHIIEAQKDEEEPSEETPGEEEPGSEDENQPSEETPDGEDKNQPSDDEKGETEDGNTYKINGIAWLDKNEDGQKQEDEKLYEGIKVKLLDISINKIASDDSGKEITATTDKNGFYTLTGIRKGKYVVIFEYDTSKYVLATYKKDGIAESKNSNVVSKKLNIDGTEKTYAVTDTIIIENANISSINIGLVEAKTFDLKLNKYVSKIIVQNADGTKTYEYNNETLAKVELDAKKINNSTVVVEYKIAITNAGQISGYVTSIVDYVPQSLKFSSELNKDWYQSGSNLYNASLAKEKIEPGETKVVTLTLTKTMTENNTGLINNTAEIASAYNEQDIKDTNSTPGNNVKTENDQGSADVIISIRTGAAIIYTTLTIAILIVVGATIYIIKKKTLNKEI